MLESKGQSIRMLQGGNETARPDPDPHWRLPKCQRCSIVVRNIPSEQAQPKLNEGRMMAICARFGNLTEFKLIRQDNVSTRHAEMRYQTHQDTEYAAHTLAGCSIYGHTLRVSVTYPEPDETGNDSGNDSNWCYEDTSDEDNDHHHDVLSMPSPSIYPPGWRRGFKRIRLQDRTAHHSQRAATRAGFQAKRCIAAINIRLKERQTVKLDGKSQQKRQRQ